MQVFPHAPLQIYIKDNEQQSLIKCDICIEKYSYQDNKMVICKICNVAVHQKCYGSELLQFSGFWICERCTFLRDNKLWATPFKIKCKFCPELAGIMKKVEFENEKIWCHLFCAIWIPEVFFPDEIKRNKIILTSFKKLENRKNQTCLICNESYGYCLNCETEVLKKSKCKTYFHPTCAKVENLIVSTSIMKIFLNDDKLGYCFILCPKHLIQRIGTLNYKNSEIFNNLELKEYLEFWKNKQNDPKKINLNNSLKRKYEELIKDNNGTIIIGGKQNCLKKNNNLNNNFKNSSNLKKINLLDDSITEVSTCDSLLRKDLLSRIKRKEIAFIQTEIWKFCDNSNFLKNHIQLDIKISEIDIVKIIKTENLNDWKEPYKILDYDKILNLKKNEKDEKLKKEIIKKTKFNVFKSQIAFKDNYDFFFQR